MEDHSECQKKDEKEENEEKIQKSIIFNLPKEWGLYDDIIDRLKTAETSYFTAALLPTTLLSFKHCCHLCIARYQIIFNFERCIVLSHRHGDEMINLTEKMKILDENIKALRICQAKLNKDLCPLITEHNLIEKDREVNVMKLVENWFTDEEIFKHKDILLAMNSGGWVPIALLSTKLQELLYLDDAALVKYLSQSELLLIDNTGKFVRRYSQKLPITDEFKQIFLLDIPDSIKSKKQLPDYLKIDGSTVEFFDYGTHSALLSLNSRAEAEKIVKDGLESLFIQCRLLVPDIIESDNKSLTKDGCNEIHKLLNNLVVKECFDDDFHVSRIDPSELTYTFAADFNPPCDDIIDKIVTQCNFYFSDVNILKDLFILKKIKASSGGWLDINIISKFKLMVVLSNNNVDNVVYAMCFSDQVQISRDGKYLRRRLPLPEWDSSIYIRSLFLWRLPDHCESFESLDRVFKVEGRFMVKVSRFIKANRNVPTDLRKLVDKIPALGQENCGVVEFFDRDSMISAHDYIRMKWPSVKAFYLDVKSDLPKPAVIVGRITKHLPPPIPISDSSANPISSLQAGTRVDPRFWKAAQNLDAKKRDDRIAVTSMFINNEEFPPLPNATLTERTNVTKNVFITVSSSNSVSTKYVSTKDVLSKDASSKDASSKDASTKGASLKDPLSKRASKKKCCNILGNNKSKKIDVVKRESKENKPSKL